MKATQIKTIDVNCKEWFDKVNGNSYFAGEIIVNAGKKNETIIKLPFQYGYGDHYRYIAFEIVKNNLNTFKTVDRPRQAYEKYKIKTNHSIKRNCLKRELL
jgi:hypothetical protein|nr:MAG TPA: hypothetical protein [Caudoviricetes sp.]